MSRRRRCWSAFAGSAPHSRLCGGLGDAVLRGDSRGFPGDAAGWASSGAQDDAHAGH